MINANGHSKPLIVYLLTWKARMRMLLFSGDTFSVTVKRSIKLTPKLLFSKFEIWLVAKWLQNLKIENPTCFLHHEACKS